LGLVFFQDRGRATNDPRIRLFHSEEDGGYIADIPELKVCSAFGKSPEAALTEVEKAEAAWLETVREMGKDPRVS
jgi:predicted RNase H-like HicB family nuclease